MAAKKTPRPTPKVKAVKNTKPLTPSWRWTTQKEKAAHHIALGKLPLREIADKCDTTVAALKKWQQVPEFSDRVSKILDGFQNGMLTLAVANQAKRILAQNDRWQALNTLITERGKKYRTDPRLKDVPGGATGLLTKTYKAVGAGRNSKVFLEHAVDKVVLQELRALESQVATELGQIKQSERDGGNGPAVVIREIRVPDSKAGAINNI